MRPASVCGWIRSAVYLALPETFSGPSTRGTWPPMFKTRAISFMGEPRGAQKRRSLPHCTLCSVQCGFSSCALPASWAARLAGGQQRGGMLHGLDDLHVACAAADVAAKRLADFPLAGPRIAPQQSGRRGDETGRAVAAL